ncbi:hypothetical protein AW27_031985 [Streptomyces sp. PCS3-D2]|uniref:hypothetical protein n=1 Tax=Streptomyces sp. PCS3-D2 TaxID=1460244 RepID=UPI000449B53B|nr:hypothetical protein [Streptomyces sp. PCS3-D2]WKV75737.1 hypothetical protein AW27_031985 [Streptomyces sp. PCS3-D2]
MSEAAGKTRRVFSGVDSSGPVPVEYKFSHARNGNRHLVVVFADRHATGGYGWMDGQLQELRSNILWVRDLVDGANTYHLCRGMDFSLEQSVAGLVARVMNALALSAGQVTAFGASEGGSAALFFGLKYGFRNIVADSPQFLMGTHVKESNPDAARMMMGEATDQNVRVLDSILPELVGCGAGPSANIYLLASPRDGQYQRQVEPFIGHFRGRENFNLVYNESPLITEAGKATRHNLPTLMGLLTLLVDGITPRIGMVRNGGEEPGRDASAIDTYLKQTAQVRDDSFPKPVVRTPSPDERVPANGVRFTGTAVGAVRVSFWEDGKYRGSAPVAPDGTWVWERTTPWSKGRHVIRLFAADANNYQTKRTEVAFIAGDHTYAATPAQEQPPQQPMPSRQPALTVTVPAPHQQVTSSAVGFAGYAPGAVRVDFHEGGAPLGACEVRPDGSWVWEPGWSWNDGEHYVEAIAVDAVGHVSPWAAVPFTTLSAYPVPAQGVYFNSEY